MEDIIELNVPFAEKDEAKNLGAKWDPQKKTWYIHSNNTNQHLFEKWLPEFLYEIYADEYFLIKNITQDMENELEKQFNVKINLLPNQDHVVVISYIIELSEQVQKQISSIAQNFKIDFSKTVQKKYWMNHCSCCGAKLGDFNLRNDSISNMTRYHFKMPFDGVVSQIKKGFFLFDAIPIAIDVP